MLKEILGRFNMSVELKKRISTSFLLFFGVFCMFINNFVSAYFLIVLAMFTIIEFFNIIKIILNKSKIRQLFINLVFTTYIFAFCYFFIFFSSHFYLKILLFLILITCVVSDIGGFIFGKIFKGPKLTKISPKKTIAGSVGSFIFSSLIIFFIIYLMTNNFDFYVLIIGILTSTACQLGDLFFSYLKRKASLKHTGSFLPGHGGVIDRVDGILLGLPVGFISLLLIY
mgnify:CR=1 FL=1